MKFIQGMFMSFKGALLGLFFVPAFYLILNLDRSAEELLSGALIAVRIGTTVLLINVVMTWLFYFVASKNNILKAKKLRLSMPFRITVGLGGMLIGLVFASVVEAAFFDNNFGWKSVMIGLVVGGTTYCVFLYRSVLRDTQDYNLQLRAESAEANMNALKNQMQPHFLFNSLNSLAELIDSNREQASTMTQKLSDLYREILEASKLPKSTLQNELSIVGKYLELESLRFGNRLKFEVQCPANAESILLPSLILQTLVENSVKHGISQSLHGGLIMVQVKTEPKGYRVQVQNPQGDHAGSITPSTGTGLANTKARLDLMYGDLHGFELKIHSGRTYVEFWISGT